MGIHSISLLEIKLICEMAGHCYCDLAGAHGSCSGKSLANGFCLALPPMSYFVFDIFLNLNVSKTMNELMKSITGPILLLLMALLQVTPALAQSDLVIRVEIEAQLAKSEKMRDAKIEVHVEQRLVVLTGTTRLYEQKLISERIAWTASGVTEVDNEIKVVPTLPMSDAAIEWKIKEIVKFNLSLHVAGIVAVVKNGAVNIQGSFSEISALIFLKHEVAKIEGVVDIRFTGEVIARSSITKP